MVAGLSQIRSLALRSLVALPLLAMLAGFVALSTGAGWQVPSFLVLSLLAFPLILNQPVWGLYALIFLSPLFSPKIDIGIANLYLHQLIIMAATVSLVLHATLIQRRGFEVRLSVGLWCFTAAFLASMASSPSLARSFKWLLLYGVLLNAGILTAMVLKRRAEVSRIMTIQGWTLVVLVVFSLEGLVEQLLGRSARLDSSLTYDNPNAFGNYLAMTLPLLLAILLAQPAGHPGRTLRLCALAAPVLLLLLTYSRSSWLGFLAGSLVVLWSRHKRLATLFLVVVLVLGLAIPSVSGRAMSLGPGGDALESGVLYRLLKSKIALDMFLDKPVLGNGPGSFQLFAETSGIPYLERHSTLENQYMMILAEEGALGLLCFLAMALLALLDNRRILRELRTARFRGLVLGCSGVCVSMLCIGMGESVIFFPKYNWFLGFTLALPRCLLAIERKEYALFMAARAGRP